LDQVIRVMKRHRKGIDVATLVKKTGFGEQRIRNTLNRAYREGKISRIKRGVYLAL
jgi:predicted transcriptional regulator of viral defense system